MWLWLVFGWKNKERGVRERWHFVRPSVLLFHCLGFVHIPVNDRPRFFARRTPGVGGDSEGPRVAGAVARLPGHRHRLHRCVLDPVWLPVVSSPDARRLAFNARSQSVIPLFRLPPTHSPLPPTLSSRLYRQAAWFCRTFWSRRTARSTTWTCRTTRSIPTVGRRSAAPLPSTPP